MYWRYRNDISNNTSNYILNIVLHLAVCNRMRCMRLIDIFNEDTHYKLTNILGISIMMWVVLGLIIPIMFIAYLIGLGALEWR